MEEIIAPDFGESVFEASVGQWFKSTGETVEVGEPIVELHTDKAVQEINAVQSGVIGALLKQVDDVVRPGDALCEFQSSSAESTPEPSPIAVEEPVVEVAVEDVAATEGEAVEVPDSDDEVDVSEDEQDEGYVEIQFGPFVEMPSVSDPVEAIGTTEEDVQPESAVEAEIETQDASSETALDTDESEAIEQEVETTSSDVSQPAVDSQISELRQIVDEKPVRRERLSRRRITTARRMAQVQAEAVMTTTYNEVDMHEVIRIRRDFGDQFMETNGVKLGFMSFFVKAVLNGLKAFPILNSELDGDELVYKEYYDIGVAVAGDHGLVVPVIRDSDNKSFAEIETEIRGFAEKARTGSFSLEDLVGGTFTITNGGVFGSMMSTPILNPPQVGILGMHNIVDRPVVVDGEITIRPMMYLAVTYDHRVVEGAHAVQFLMRIKESLESAELLMLAN